MTKSLPFNPNDWLSPANNRSSFHQPTSQSLDTENEIEALTRAIETSGIDITKGYNNWLSIAFALADALGEAGIDYFQRLSRFYPNYNPDETAKQFHSCLRSTPSSGKNKITVSTLFFIAALHGIRINNSETHFVNPSSSSTQPVEEFEEFEESQNAIPPISSADVQSQNLASPNSPHLPTFSPSIRPNLPNLMQRIIEDSPSDVDADILILGSLTVFSACFPNVYGVYDQREVFPNLFLYVTAPASAGKGRLSLCRHLAMPLHQVLRKEYEKNLKQFKEEQAAFAVNRKDPLALPPKEPPFLTLFVPANSTATVVYQTLAENNGVGLIFETEGDTLANAFKSDLGNYSDGFRKAFHHETISYLRRKDHEFVEILRPKFSAVLTGTRQQVSSLIPDAENGLFSRFIFYSMQTELVWRDMFSTLSGSTADERFRTIGKDFYAFQKKLPRQLIQFTLSFNQKQRFNEFFAYAQQNYACAFGDEIVASVRRLGLIHFRIAMILSVLRLMDESPLASGEGSGVRTSPLASREGSKVRPSPLASGEGSGVRTSPRLLKEGKGNFQLVCTDNDFQTAFDIIKVLLQHSAEVFQSLPHCKGNFASSPKGSRQLANASRARFLDALPDAFDRQGYLNTAASLGIPAKTAERYIREFCDSAQILHPSNRQYTKPITQ